MEITYLYGYNASGELETVTYPSVATPARYFYDPGHLLKEYKDPRGNTAQSTTYDAAGLLQSVTDIDGTRWGTCSPGRTLTARRQPSLTTR